MSTMAIDRGLGAELAADLAAAAFTLAKRFAAGATMWSLDGSVGAACAAHRGRVRASADHGKAGTARGSPCRTEL